jgi:hypothetical protein
MIIEAQPTFSKILKANFTMAYSRPIIIVINLLGLFYVFQPFIFPSFGTDETFQFIQIVFIGVLLLLPVMIYLRTRKIYISTSVASEKRAYEFTSDKVLITSESFKAEVLWNKIYKIQELREFMLIYTTPYLAYTIPKEAFGDKLDEFRELVKSKPVKQKLRN